jgi:LysR family transcriptional regulator of gallate degradation
LQNNKLVLISHASLVETTARSNLAQLREFRDDPIECAEGLQHLKVFLAVAGSNSIAKTAPLVYKAPSAVTRSILELERSLGTTLFERKPRGMLLTASGVAVRTRAARIHEEVQAAADEYCRTARQSSPCLRNSICNLFSNGRKLQLLVQLADLRSLTTAATSLGISQAGASMALARMESAIGESLFRRVMEGMVATEAAERLVLRAKRILAEMRHMRADVSAHFGKLAGSVTIGTLPLGRTLVVPTAIAAAVDLYPGLRVTMIESPYEQLVSLLRCGEVDMVFGALRCVHPSEGLKTEHLFSDQMSIVARAGHPLAQRDRLDLEDLLEERWILARPDTPGRRLVEASFHEAGLPAPVPSVETGDLALLRLMLVCSNMITAISAQQLFFELHAGTIVELPVELANTTRQIGLTLREGALLSPAATVVLEEIRRLGQRADFSFEFPKLTLGANIAGSVHSFPRFA